MTIIHTHSSGRRIPHPGNWWALRVFARILQQEGRLTAAGSTIVQGAYRADHPRFGTIQVHRGDILTRRS